MTAGNRCGWKDGDGYGGDNDHKEVSKAPNLLWHQKTALQLAYVDHIQNQHLNHRQIIAHVNEQYLLQRMLFLSHSILF